ncbi:MAG: XTP/dITP diphosphatase [Bacteroidota bacterium]|nr:XTP/dITP diphosphatase [Bacteroidota bacterium]
MKSLVVASNNEGKLREIKEILSDLNLDLKSLKDYPEIPEIIEDGKTFEENALKKAREVFNILQVPVLSDDSGLEVHALNMQPGVYSARFAGEPKDHQKNNQKLLKFLENYHDDEKKARFRCVVVFKTFETEHIVEGFCTGRIINELRGSGGFGYDPLFIPDGYQQTFAELTQEVKNSISHRGRAFSLIKPIIKNYT